MADVNCPYYEFLWSDILKSCYGSGKCMFRGIEMDANLYPLDYYDCDSDNYPTCFYYKLNKEKTNSERKTDA